MTAQTLNGHRRPTPSPCVAQEDSPEARLAEPHCRLSESILWRWQRNYFEQQGIEAWSRGEVPHHVTSCPYIANAYARVVLGFLRDGLATPAGGDQSTARTINPDRPVYIIELGCGPGRFGYLFVKALERLRANPLFRGLSIRYILTDFAEQNLDYLQAHPWLRPFYAAGLLDLARFDVETDNELTLRCRGDVLGPGTLSNPTIVIANYLFDSIPQDAFALVGSRLQELLPTLSKAANASVTDDTRVLQGAELSYRARPVDGPYYNDPSWDRLLDLYRERLRDTSFLFPIAALRCIRNLRSFSSGPMLLLSGDRGYSRDEALLTGLGAPLPALHGSFSLRVDYQILGEYCRNLGGLALHPAHRHGDLHISALLFGKSSSTFPETEAAYAEAIERFGPDDFWTLRKGVEKSHDFLTLEQILALLRLSGWDHKRFIACLPALRAKQGSLSEAQQADLVEAIQRVWENYLPIGEEEDLAFEIGSLLIGIRHFDQARIFFGHSVDLRGLAPETAFQIALCHHRLGMPDAARDWAEQALALSSYGDETGSLSTARQNELQIAAARSQKV